MTTPVRVRKKPDRDALQLYWLDPVTGLEKTKSAGTNHWRTAERTAAAWEQELSRQSGISTDLTWEQARLQFEKLRFPRMKPASQDSCSSALDAVERQLRPDVSLQAVTSLQIERIASGWSREGKRPATINTYLAWLGTLLRWAHRHELLGRLPRIPEKLRTSARGRPLTAAEFHHLRRVTRTVQPDDWRQWLRLLRGLWLSGLRISEALELDWTTGAVRLDLDGGKWPAIVFTQSGQKSGRREVCPLAPDAARWFARVPRDKRTGRVFALVQPAGPYCYEGEPYGDSRVAKILAAIGAASGIVVGDQGKTATAHDLRRSFGTRWSYKVRPLTLQKMMRHAAIETTLKYYVCQDVDRVAEELWG